MQADLCKSAAEAAARVATTTDEKAWHEALDKFWMLYWGPLVIVEDVDSRDLLVTNEKTEMDRSLEEKRKKLSEDLKKNPKTPVTDSMILFALQVRGKTNPPPPT
jgi:hypothetical protein